MFSLLDWLQRHPRRQRYAAHRPAIDETLGRRATPKEKPRVWWRYAIAAVRSDVRARSRAARWNLTAAFLAERRHVRRRYIELFKSKILGELRGAGSGLPGAPASEGAAFSAASAERRSVDLELRQLETRLSYEDIVFFRSLARADSDFERAVAKLARAPTNSVSDSWTNWAWSFVSARQSTDEHEAASDRVAGADAAHHDAGAHVAPRSAELDDELRRKFYATIEYDPSSSAPSALVTAAEHVTLAKVRVVVRQGSCTVRRTSALFGGPPPTSGTRGGEIVRALFAGLAVKLDQRVSTTKVLFVQLPPCQFRSLFLGQLHLILDSLQVFDLYTPGTRFPRLVYPTGGALPVDAEVNREIIDDMAEFVRLTGKKIIEIFLKKCEK